MSSRSRQPRVGDMLIVRSMAPLVITDGTDYVCLVTSIKPNVWGHSEKVFVTWQGPVVPGYIPDCGFSGMNITNNRHKFRVFRDGQELL